MRGSIHIPVPVAACLVVLMAVVVWRLARQAPPPASPLVVTAGQVEIPTTPDRIATEQAKIQSPAPQPPTTDQRKAVVAAAGRRPGLFSISFCDLRHGWAAGQFGRIFVTTDGGESWRSQVSGTTAPLYSVDCVDATHGWTAMAGSGFLLATSDGGGSWKRRPVGPFQAFAVQILDTRQGWVVGSNGTILATTDGGANWRPQFIRSSIMLLESVHFVDESRGWVAGTEGTILASTDGGGSWSPQSSGTAERLRSVYFVDHNHGWVVGFNGTILATTDGGASWKPQVSGTQVVLNSIYFIDAAHGWTVGGRGTILATTDGGASWKPQVSGIETGQMELGYFVYPTLYSVCFVDANHGWTSSNSGVILATSDGGATWRRQFSVDVDSLPSGVDPLNRTINDLKN